MELRKCRAGGEIIANLFRRPDQGHGLDHLGGDSGDGLLLVARQVQLLDLQRFGLEPGPGDGVEVEVGTAGTHATGVEGEMRADHVGGRGAVGGDVDEALYFRTGGAGAWAA